jgi:hypothetical protein
LRAAHLLQMNLRGLPVATPRRPYAAVQTCRAAQCKNEGWFAARKFCFGPNRLELIMEKSRTLHATHLPAKAASSSGEPAASDTAATTAAPEHASGKEPPVPASPPPAPPHVDIKSTWGKPDTREVERKRLIRKDSGGAARQHSRDHQPRGR